MTPGSDGQRVVRQLDYHDLDDVYELVAGLGVRLEGIEGRLGWLDSTQQQVLTTQREMQQLLREVSGR